MGTTLTGVAGLILAWLGGISFFGAIAAAVSAFMGWALARELDPDSETTANIAMAAAAVFGLIATPQLLVVGVLLIVTRVLAGTVGSRLRLLDLVVLVGAAAYAGSQPLAWPLVALLVYSTLRTQHRLARPAAVTMVVSSLIGAVLFVSSLEPASPSFATWLVLIGLAAIGWRRIRVSSVETRADNGDPIAESGVSLARLSTLTAIAAGAVLAPETALADLSPAISAFAAVALTPRRNPPPEEVLDEPPAVVEATPPPLV